MTDIDAAELARLREKWSNGHPVDVHALLDALEKARGEAAAHETAVSVLYQTCERLLAERDSARALLGEMHGWLNNSDADRARIAKEIGQ